MMSKFSTFATTPSSARLSLGSAVLLLLLTSLSEPIKALSFHHKQQQQFPVSSPLSRFQSLSTSSIPSLLEVRRPSRSFTTSTRLSAQAGSFFNPVPENNDDDEDNKKETPPSVPVADNATNNPPPKSDDEQSDIADPFQQDLVELLRKRKGPSLASQPSTINGKPTAGQGFAVSKKNEKNKGNKPYVGIGPRVLNDPTKPEYDDQGYTLYADETTGEKSRVFEALVDYPCDFTLKIVGANEGSFVQEMVAVVAESCHVAVEKVPHTVRALGKWTSVTVQAPVKSAEMLYQLYENVDRDPRVRFKF